MLEHSTVAITLDLYSHVIEGMQREAAKVMDALVWRGRLSDGRGLLSALLSNRRLALPMTQPERSRARTRGGAGGGTRTHTGLPPTVFETAASAIPPRRHRPGQA